MEVCGRGAVYMPPLGGILDGAPLFLAPDGCPDCSVFEARLAKLEALLKDMSRLNISKTDTDGKTVTATYIGTGS